MGCRCVTWRSRAPTSRKPSSPSPRRTIDSWSPIDDHDHDHPPVAHLSKALRRVRLAQVRRALRNRRYVMLAIAIPVVFYLLYTGVLSGAAADADTLVDGL